MGGISTSCRSVESRPSTPAIRSSATAAEPRPRVEPRRSGRLLGRDGPWLVVLGALGVALFLLRQRQIAGTAGWSSFPLDDSWIHLQFARNLADGHGFSYNPGVPVAGSTSPLWTLVLAGVFTVLGVEPGWAKLIGVGATLMSALLAWQLGWRCSDSRAIALVAGAATVIAGPMLWGALSGMEVSLAALLVTAALICHLDERDWVTAALLGLAALTRPESLLLIPLCWLARPVTWRRTVILFGVAAVCLGPWVLFNLATTGSPLPATASAKIEGGLVGFLSGAREPWTRTFLGRPWQFVEEWVRWLWTADALLPILIVPGLGVLWRRYGRIAAVPAAVLLIHPIGMALLAPYRGPGFQEGRYSIQLLPLAIVVAATALDALRRWPRLHAVSLVLFLAAAMAAAAPAASRYAWAVQNIDAMQVRLGHWVAAHTAPSARLGVNDVGAIAYISRREVVDLMGLVTPAIIPYRRQGEDGVLRYLERACPDYLIIFPAWFPSISAASDRFTPIYRVRLDHNAVAGADEMVVYETSWNRWRPAPRPCAGSRP